MNFFAKKFAYVKKKKIPLRPRLGNVTPYIAGKEENRNVRSTHFPHPKEP